MTPRLRLFCTYFLLPLAVLVAAVIGYTFGVGHHMASGLFLAGVLAGIVTINAA